MLRWHWCRMRAGSRRWPCRVMEPAPPACAVTMMACWITVIVMGWPGGHPRARIGDRSASRPRASTGVTVQYSDGVGVGPAQLHRSLDFARDLGEGLRPFLILPALAVHDIGEFGMAGHGSILGARF